MDFGSNDIYIFSPFSLFVSVYMYASVFDFVCIALLLPFVLGFCLSFFFLITQKIFFLIIIFFNNFILFYFTFILFSSFFLSFLPPFYSEPCGGQALGAPAKHQGCATEVESQVQDTGPKRPPSST